MKTRQPVRIAAALMTCALLLTAPLAMAQGYGKGDSDSNRGKHQRMQTQCEHMNSAEMQERRAQHQKNRLERHNETAGRLQLNEDQQKIWNDIHQERQQQMEKKMNEMQKRCDKMAK